jgi:hypothetical protein
MVRGEIGRTTTLPGQHYGRTERETAAKRLKHSPGASAHYRSRSSAAPVGSSGLCEAAREVTSAGWGLVVFSRSQNFVLKIWTATSTNQRIAGQPSGLWMARPKRLRARLFSLGCLLGCPRDSRGACGGAGRSFSSVGPLFGPSPSAFGNACSRCGSAFRIRASKLHRGCTKFGMSILSVYEKSRKPFRIHSFWSAS